MIKRLLFYFCLITGASSFGQSAVSNFTLTNIVDGSSISLDTYSETKGVVIIFVSNVCPYDGYYQDRIKNIVNTYSGKVKFLLINSYQEPEEAEDKMKAAYERWGLGVPYLSDKDQVVFNMLGAKKSPEAFVLSGVPGKHILLFDGPIDDNAQSAAAVTRSYLKEAIDAQLAGKGIAFSDLRTIGCTIRRK